MEEVSYKTITPEAFSKLDYATVTLVDLREPDEVLVHGIEGAINIPFSQFATRLDEIPREKPVYVFCRVGDWSEQMAEILADRGYDVTHLAGGYQALRRYLEGEGTPPPPAETIQKPAERTLIDAKGLKCPGPIVKVADWLRDKPEGTQITAEATEDAFYSDIRIWCERTGRSSSFSSSSSQWQLSLYMRKKPSPGNNARSCKQHWRMLRNRTTALYADTG